MVAAPPYENPVIRDETTGTTANGTQYTRFDLKFLNREAYALAPKATALWTHTTLLTVVHGMTGDRNTYSVASTWPIVQAALDRGWVVLSASHGNNWGNSYTMSGIQDGYNWAARRWWIDRNLLFGHSMGGMSVTVATGRKVIPDIAGTITLNAMLDVYDYRSPYTLSAYGATSWDDLPAKIVGHDPMSDPAEWWRDAPFLIVDTPSDTSLRQSDKFIARSVTPSVITHQTGSHGHNDNPFISEEVAWMDGRAPRYATGQAQGSQPVPKWDGWDVAPAPAPSGSGVYWSDGREASLYRGDGTLARLSWP